MTWRSIEDLLTPTLTLVSWTNERTKFAAEHSRNTSNPDATVQRVLTFTILTTP